MTNKECKIKNLRQRWGDLLLEKEGKIKEIWEIEYKLNLIKENLLRYGIPEENSGMGSNETDMGEGGNLDNCFTHNYGTPFY